MSVQLHPRLAELERLTAEDGTTPSIDGAAETAVTPGEGEVAANPEVQVQPEAEAREQFPPVPEDDFFLKIDKRQPYQSLRSLSENDKAVSDALETMIGRKAKAKYGPEMEALKAELESARAELRKHEFGKLTDQEVSQRFGTDPQFATEYAATVHAKPIDVEAVRQKQALISTFNQEVDRAEGVGVLPGRLAQYEQWIQTGAFERDQATGQSLAPVEQYRRLREIVDNDIVIHRNWLASQQVVARAPQAAAAAAPQTMPVQAAAPVAPVINPRLAEASPDLSAGSHGSAVSSRISRADVQRMNPLERIARWPTSADFERDFKAGLITD